MRTNTTAAGKLGPVTEIGILQDRGLLVGILARDVRGQHELLGIHAVADRELGASRIG
jgi:hypothetical protein